MDKKQSSKIKLSNEKREALISKIKKYFLKERDEELGELGAALVLDFVVNELATEFYNQGIYDAYTYMNDKVDDMLGIQK